MLTQAWEDAYHELWKHAAHHRGLREAIGEPLGHTLTQTPRQWPRTCGADVLAIASVIDPVLRAAPLESGGYGIERTWRSCAAELADVALREPAHEYRHNRAFWSALASTAAYLASVDAPVPEAMWPALLAEVASPDHAPRNAINTGNDLPLEALSYDELWRTQKAELAKRRGTDVRDPAPGAMGGRMAIPRTTNADVLQLGTYWYEALAHVELVRRAMGHPGIQILESAGMDGEIRRALPLFVDLDTFATGEDPHAIYPRNEAFWRGTASLAATLAVIDHAPRSFTMDLDTDPPRPLTERRNATYPGEGTFKKMWDRQHDDFVKARGFDTRDALPGGRPMTIPRTLNAEIVKLAEYWNAAWMGLQNQILGNPPSERLDPLRLGWQAVMKDVYDIATPDKRDDIYSKNHEFWRQTFELAQTLDRFKETPSKFEISIDVPQTLPDRLAQVVGQIADAVGDIAHKAGEGVTSGLGKPILIGGSVVLGGLLLWRFVRPRPRAVGAA